MTRISSESLSREEEHRLAKAARLGEPTALHELVVRHRPLVAAMAHRYVRSGNLKDDLVHEGFVGLLDAASRFDPDRGTRFSTYARFWVRYHMQRYLRDNRRMVTPSKTRNMRKLRQRMRRTAAELEQTLQREVTSEELAEALEVSVSEILEAQQELRGRDVPVLAEEPHGHEPATDFSPEDWAEQAERRDLTLELAEQALAALDDRERHIVVQRVLSDDRPSLREIGEKLSVSGERVRQIEAVAMKKMRAALRAPSLQAQVGALVAA